MKIKVDEGPKLQRTMKTKDRDETTIPIRIKKVKSQDDKTPKRSMRKMTKKPDCEEP